VSTTKPSFHFSEQTAELTFDGDWLLEQPCPSAKDVLSAVGQQPPTLRIIAGDSLRWDSQLMSRLYQLQQHRGSEQALDLTAMPAGVQQLMQVAMAVKPVPANQQPSRRIDWLASAKVVKQELIDFTAFVGEVTLAVGRLIKGQANTRLSDLMLFIQQAGPNAIGIVTLVSLLVGMILAYLGLVQLKMFGAEIYVANLVTIGMVREMGALMTAVIMAGRTGAAYAAQLGTMQANEEVDAITTLGINPMEFLVLPRLFALMLMMPLMCLYADAIGLIGGALVATGMDITFNQYIAQSREAIVMGDVFTGVFKAFVFAILIAIAGCKAGIQSGRNSAAVGEATTKAVVTATVYLVIADAGLNILYDKLGI
jgi:phospholipid/cholesterol/gamma-HCH transport system permease protein